jgi:hypothetical protein
MRLDWPQVVVQKRSEERFHFLGAAKPAGNKKGGSVEPPLLYP